ncbi:helix-turn-helix transcriptional regulator, partial [Myxococcota bacterium]|nr:helix-turn-helix transcriptional regulator [Myxococcota bacterium]
MVENNISQNLRRLRGAQNLTQEHLAEKSGLSRAAYRNIETGKSEPRVGTLQAIALALDVSIEKLVVPVRMARAVRFRSNKKMRTRDQILVDVGRWLTDFEALEEILNDRVTYKLADIQKRLRKRKNRGEAAAALARESFSLNTQEPIRDICGLLESAGIKVGSHSIASHNFFGLSVAVGDGGPAVVVNTWDRISVER